MTLSLSSRGALLLRDTVRMTTGPGEADTVRDVEAPEDVKSLFARLSAGETVERTALVEHLERMLGLVRTTAQSFDDAVLLLQRTTPLTLAPGRRAPDAYDVHALPDGSALVHTTWTVADKARLFHVLRKSHRSWIAEHADPRGFPVLSAAQLDVARAARSYDDALYLLGDAVTFLK